MSSNYSTIIDKGELHGDYVIQIFTTLFSGQDKIPTVLLKVLRVIGTQEKKENQEKSFRMLLRSITSL